MAMKPDAGKAGLEESDNSKIRITLTAKSVAPLEKSKLPWRLLVLCRLESTVLLKQTLIH